MAGLHLVRRGGVYWWRRRIPAELLTASRDCDRGVNHRFMPGAVGGSPNARASRGRTHLALSLRTRCPREARRRAIRLTALCDYAWSLMMTSTSPAAPLPHPLTLADGLLTFLGKGVDAYQSTLVLHAGDALARADAEDRAEAGLRREIRNALVAPPDHPAAPENDAALHAATPPSPRLIFMKTGIATLEAQNAALREQERKLDQRISLCSDLEVILGRVEAMLACPSAAPAPEGVEQAAMPPQAEQVRPVVADPGFHD
jgi:hypothetical protein